MTFDPLPLSDLRPSLIAPQLGAYAVALEDAEAAAMRLLLDPADPKALAEFLAAPDATLTPENATWGSLSYLCTPDVVRAGRTVAAAQIVAGILQGDCDDTLLTRLMVSYEITKTGRVEAAALYAWRMRAPGAIDKVAQVESAARTRGPLAALAALLGG